MRKPDLDSAVRCEPLIGEIKDESISAHIISAGLQEEYAVETIEVVVFTAEVS